MKKPIFRFTQCMIAIGLAAYLSEKIISGRLSYYINLRFAVLTIVAIIGLVIMSVIGLIPLFSESQSHQIDKDGKKTKKIRTNIIIIFFFPIFIAQVGLPTYMILFMFVMVFFVGLVRLNLFNKFDQKGNQQLSEIPGTTLVILSIPLLLGIFVPVKPLSTSSLNTRGMSLSAPASIGQQSVKTMEVAPDDRTVLDWIKIFNYEQDLSPYIGKPANVIGFVYHDPRLKTDQFMVGRFVITCCVADAFAIGMAVDWPKDANLVDNSWVNVKGTVDELTIDGQKEPVIHAIAVNPIQAPDQPYLYP